MGGASGGSRVTRWATLAVATAVLVFHQVRLQPWTLDDAFISMRYAWNLAHGSGLVYNAGDPVEGYTNFLWTVLLAPAALVGKDMVLWAKVLGASCTFATLATVAWSDRLVPRHERARGDVERAPPRHERCVHALVAVGDGGAARRVARAARARRAREGRARNSHGRASPESRASRARMRTWCSFRSSSTPSRRGVADGRGSRASRWSRCRTTRGASGPTGICLPNTFYVKVGGTVAALARGIFYLNDFLGVELGLVLLLALGVFAGQRLLAPGIRALPLYLFVHVLYVVAVGGDVFQGFRFFAPLMPVLACCAGIAIDEARRGVAAGAFAIAVHGGALLVNDQLGQSGEISDVGERIGKWLRDCAPPDAVLATNIAGAAPFYSRLETIDTLGLNDRHIAHREMPAMGEGKAGHEKGDGAYVLVARARLRRVRRAQGERDAEVRRRQGARRNPRVPRAVRAHEVRARRRRELPRVGAACWRSAARACALRVRRTQRRATTAPDALVPFAEKRIGSSTTRVGRRRASPSGRFATTSPASGGGMEPTGALFSPPPPPEGEVPEGRRGRADTERARRAEVRR